MKIRLYDTTLRDGTQGEGMSLSLNDKILIARMLDDFGVHYIEGGWPGSNPKDAGFFNEVRKLKLKNAVVCAFGSTRRAGGKAKTDNQINALIEANTKAVTIFGKSWDMHVTDVIKTPLKENLEMIRDSVDYLKSKKKEVIYDAEHFFDGFNANPDYALESIKAAEEAGADNITLCDTNGGTTPERVAQIVEEVKKAVRVSLGIHCHNDMELAVANSLAAVRAGCDLIHGTVNGYGERCGNANLISIIPVLQFKMGYSCVKPENVRRLTEISHYVAEVCNMPINNNQPFTGRSAFAHKGGVHVNAVTKTAKSYEHITPDSVGNERRFLVSELSGKTNVLLKASELGIKLDKNSPETTRILDRIQDLENEGYQFEAAEASFELIIKKTLGKYRKFFDLQGFRVMDLATENGRSVSEAAVRLSVNGKEEHTAAQGDGPVNALDLALRKALIKFYPAIEKIHLVDFKVRVINGAEGTAAKVRVFITFQDEKETWSTVGVSTNIIEASWQALVEAIEYKLLKS
ncbi:MAG: citramalate synthase [Candidatus Omnitrophica bacterium]|nr:citramalate synthase [Candidatus Omnitrophota bacterium]